MRFADLRPGQLARIPTVHAKPGELPPVVRVESVPDACEDVTCGCWRLDSRDIETGQARPYHRNPAFPVTVVTPAASAAGPKEAA
ncbi:hypothetical protein [Nonomuraea bangladeshensis]|uniref:hypothetical protein n=1 Tax=Nonomuraea bangladeshensis TaxID=404385 RepID=UPI003C2DF466